MPTSWDFALVAGFAVLWPLYVHFIEWPRHVKRVEAGDADARVAIFRRTILQQWLFAGVAIALFYFNARPFDALGLRAPQGWRLLLGIAIPALYATLMALQIPAIMKSDKSRASLRVKLAPLKPLVPHRAEEWHWFMPLSVTAGICEELLFRGFLVWALQPWLGLYGAAAVSVVIFGLAHSYQGFTFGRRAFFAGALMGVFVLLTGSIVPAMFLHAMIDLGSGYVCYTAMREPQLVPAAA
jgi:membrane protease YdiL (CAAX protease family)